MHHLVQEQIEFRAYQMWEDRGRPWEEPEIDWFKAEKELAEAEPEGALVVVARDVGEALGTVVAFLADIAPKRP